MLWDNNNGMAAFECFRGVSENRYDPGLLATRYSPVSHPTHVSFLYTAHKDFPDKNWRSYMDEGRNNFK